MGERLAEVLDRIPVLRDRVAVEELPGGLTNHNLKVTTPAATYVARISGSDTDLLGIDREAEHANTVIAAEIGVGAGVVDFRPEVGMIVLDFLPGETLTDESFTDQGVLERAADASRRLHSGPAFSGDFDMFVRQASYLDTVRRRGFAHPAGYEDHASAWARVRAALTATAGPRAPCNNDLLAGNFIDDGDRVWLIDYEYSGNNDPHFELGNTATECEFTAEQTEAYVEAYFGSPSRADLARVRVQALCSQYGWSLWGFIQAATNDLDFDFAEWGTHRYEKAARLFGSPELDRLLEVLDGR